MYAVISWTQCSGVLVLVYTLFSQPGHPPSPSVLLPFVSTNGWQVCLGGLSHVLTGHGRTGDDQHQLVISYTHGPHVHLVDGQLFLDLDCWLYLLADGKVFHVFCLKM